MVSKIMPNFLQCCHARVTVIHTISRHRSRLGLFSSGPEPFQVRKAFTRRIMSRTVPGYSRPGMAEPNGGLSVTAYKAIIQRKKTRKGKKMFRCYHPTSSRRATRPEAKASVDRERFGTLLTRLAHVDSPGGENEVARRHTRDIVSVMCFSPFFYGCFSLFIKYNNCGGGTDVPCSVGWKQARGADDAVGVSSDVASGSPTRPGGVRPSIPSGDRLDDHSTPSEATRAVPAPLGPFVRVHIISDIWTHVCPLVSAPCILFL